MKTMVIQMTINNL